MPHARCGGSLAHRPGRLVETVDVLLVVEVAGKPDEVLPVAQLVFHLRPVGLAARCDSGFAKYVSWMLRISPIAPLSTRFIVSHTPWSYRQQRPETRLRFFFFASSAVASTLRTPGASTAMGFSQKTCLPASTAAFRCIGRKCGGSARITTSTSLWISFWAASNPRNDGPRHRHFVRESLRDCHKTTVHAVGEGVGHGHELAVLVGAQGIHGGAAATAAAADQADLQEVVAGGVGAARNRQPTGQNAGGRQVEVASENRAGWN